LVVQSIVTDLDGKSVARRDVKMRAVLLDWTFKNGEWVEEERNPEERCVTSAADPVECSFRPMLGGQYRVTATIIDDRGRPNRSTLTLWISGGKTPPSRDLAQQQATLIPDRKEYQAGETAEVLVQSPFYPAEGVLTLRRSGLVHTQRFTMPGPSYTVHIPIKESYIPNIELEVDLNGAADRETDADSDPLSEQPGIAQHFAQTTPLLEKAPPVEKASATANARQAPKRPGYAVGTLSLPVPPVARKLSVAATPRAAALEPGAET